MLGADVHEALVARAGGNPLYAEQFARVLAEIGSLEELPETVHGIIAARLDGLAPAEKALLQDAAVLGKVFWLGAIEAICETSRQRVEELLFGLERKEFVQQARRSRSRARPSTPSGTSCSATSPTVSSRAPPAARGTAARPPGSSRSAAPTITPRCSPTTT